MWVQVILNEFAMWLGDETVAQNKQCNLQQRLEGEEFSLEKII